MSAHQDDGCLTLPVASPLSSSKGVQLEALGLDKSARRGTNLDEYGIYVEQGLSLGWEIKPYSEWLDS